MICFGQFNKLSEGCFIMYGKLRKRFSIENNASVAQTVHEFAIGHVVCVNSGVDTGYPKATESTLSLLSTNECVGTCVHDGFVRLTSCIFSGEEEPL